MKKYAIQMTYEISDEEKINAEKAIMAFEYTEKSLKLAVNHLDLMYNPFKKNPNISPEEIFSFRAALRRYRDKSIENFNNFKEMAFKCVSLMNDFKSDTQTTKIIKSFINQIGDIESKVNEFVTLFDNLESATFVIDLINKIDYIKKSSLELEDLIDDRIVTHIKNNILGKNWINYMGTTDKYEIKNDSPVIVDLFNKRQEELNKIKY